MSYPRHNVHPVNAGWTYKGSNAQSSVDFYEKDGCRMGLLLVSNNRNPPSSTLATLPVMAVSMALLALCC